MRTASPYRASSYGPDNLDTSLVQRVVMGLFFRIRTAHHHAAALERFDMDAAKIIALVLGLFLSLAVGNSYVRKRRRFKELLDRVSAN